MIGVRIRLPFAAALALALFGSCSAPEASATDLWPGLDPGPHPVGFQVHHVYDHSRSFGPVQATPGAFPALPAGSRPLQITVWYPAAPAVDAAPMEYWEYLALKETTFDFSLVGGIFKEDVFDGARAGMQREGLDVGPLEGLLAAQALAVRDAKPAEGPFPLLVYGAGSESPGWDNFVLCEYLASHGYVVAATPSFGKNSPLMTVDFDGLEAKTRDHEFVLAYLWDSPSLDRDRVGSLGWSLGGVSAAKFAMRDSRVGAVVALDGSMAYGAYRVAADWSPDYDYDRLRVPFMYLSQRTTGPKSFGFLDELTHVDTYFLELQDLTHADFSALHVLRDIHAKGDRTQRDRRVIERGYIAVCRYTLAFFDAYLKNEDEARRFLVRTPEQNRVAGVLTVEPRVVSSPPPVTKLEFMELVRAGHVDRAIEAHVRMREIDPAIVLFDEVPLGLEALNLLRMRRPDDAVKLLELIASTTPQLYWQLCDGIAMARLAAGETEGALEAFAKSLELRPDNPTARVAVAAGDKLDSFTSPTHLEAFVGNYSGNRWNAAVTFDDGKLQFQVPGEQRDWLIPVGERHFLIAGVFGSSVEFVEGGSGVETLVFHMPDRDIRMKKN
jgi:hypothetical protein